MKLYLCGPMSSRPNYNHPAFHEAERILTAQGHTVLSPARTDNGSTDKPRAFYMRAAIELLMQADGMVLLGAWHNSEGALLELAIAQELDIPVYELYSCGEIRDHNSRDHGEAQVQFYAYWNNDE